MVMIFIPSVPPLHLFYCHYSLWWNKGQDIYDNDCTFKTSQQTCLDWFTSVVIDGRVVTVLVLYTSYIAWYHWPWNRCMY